MSSTLSNDLSPQHSRFCWDQRRDPTQCGQHGHSAVLQLSLAKPTDVDGQGETHRVETFLFSCEAEEAMQKHSGLYVSEEK